MPSCQRCRRDIGIGSAARHHARSIRAGAAGAPLLCPKCAGTAREAAAVDGAYPLAGTERIALQRLDFRYFAGRGPDGTPVWTRSQGKAQRFVSIHAADGEHRLLHNEGHQTHRIILRGG